jgi:hypothetical protein
VRGTSRSAHPGKRAFEFLRLTDGNVLRLVEDDTAALHERTNGLGNTPSVLANTL